MPALAILRFARSSRCPRVTSDVRKARAAAAVDRLETTFSVRAQSR
jgi:hypothetical protein